MATDHPIMASVAGRYATALFDLATSQNEVSGVEQDLRDFQGLIDESPDLQRLVRSPVFSADEQSKAIGAIVDRAGLKPLTSNFLRVVARNRRLFVLPDVIKAYFLLAARARGEVEAEVTTAVELSQQQLDELGDTLKGALGNAVKIQSRVDPALLGGIVVKVGSRMFDNSLATKLNSLKTRMKEVR